VGEVWTRESLDGRYAMADRAELEARVRIEYWMAVIFYSTR